MAVTPFRFGSISWRCGGAVVSAVVFVLGFPGFGHAYLAWFCLVPLLVVLDDARLAPGAVVAISSIFGLAVHAIGSTWFLGALREFGDLSLAISVTSFILLCLVQGAPLILFGIATHLLVHRGGLPLVWAAPLSLVACEWLSPAIFPAYLANTQYRWTIAIQSLDLWGPLGLSFLLALSSAVIYTGARAALDREARDLIVAAPVVIGLVAANLAYGAVRMREVDARVDGATHRIEVGVVQTNMGAHQKHRDPEEGVRRHREQSLAAVQAGAELLIWPETALPWSISPADEHVISAVLAQVGQPVILGGIRTEARPGRVVAFNTAFAADSNGGVRGRYDKVRLVPFAESPAFEPGGTPEVLALDGVRYGTGICYEATLPSLVRRLMRAEPDVLVNLTNDAWFGDTRQPHVHLALATFRAVEHRRFLVRAANSGVSAIVDPNGRVVRRTATFTRANLLGTVVPLGGRTVYGRLGDWPGPAALLGVLALWIRRRTAARSHAAAGDVGVRLGGA